MFHLITVKMTEIKTSSITPLQDDHFFWFCIWSVLHYRWTSPHGQAKVGYCGDMKSSWSLNRFLLRMSSDAFRSATGYVLIKLALVELIISLIQKLIEMGCPTSSVWLDSKYMKTTLEKWIWTNGTHSILYSNLSNPHYVATLIWNVERQARPGGRSAVGRLKSCTL